MRLKKEKEKKRVKKKKKKKMAGKKLITNPLKTLAKFPYPTISSLLKRKLGSPVARYYHKTRRQGGREAERKENEGFEGFQLDHLRKKKGEKTLT